MLLNSIAIKNSSEGPAHDPYHVVEIHVQRPQGKVVFHAGLASWVKLPDGTVCRDEDRLSALFEAAAGISPRDAQRYAGESTRRRVRSHLRACKSDLVWQEGYPGETLGSCSRCGEILDSDFDISAVE